MASEQSPSQAGAKHPLVTVTVWREEGEAFDMLEIDYDDNINVLISAAKIVIKDNRGGTTDGAET